MKKITTAIQGLLTGIVAISSVASAQSIGSADKFEQAINPPIFTTSSKPIAATKNGSPQLIVKFYDSSSFEQELKANLSQISDQPFDANQVAARRLVVEAQIDAEGQDRAADIAFQYGLEIDHERVLANGADLITVVNTNRKQSIDKIINQLQLNPAVKYVELNAMMHPLFTPNDPNYPSQWHYFESTAGLNVDTAWDTATGSGAIVAVIDTGYRPHVDLNTNIIGGYDFISDAAAARDGNGRDSNAQDEGDWAPSANFCFSGSPATNSSWHGTHVAGTIAARTNNNIGVAGVAYNAKIVPVRALGRCGGSLADIADAIIWSSGGSVSGIPSNPNPADVINMSLGGGGACDATYQSAINSAVSNGTAVIVAAGNSNQNASSARPANCNNVITVAALDRGGNRASYSNFGSVVDVAAPGGETATNANGVLSTLNSGSTTPAADSYAFYQGTSMATPHVAGVAALMKGLNSSMTPATLEATLKSTSASIPGSCSGGCGAGLVDAAAAIGGGGVGSGPTELFNGDSIGGISGAQGSWTMFQITLPAGASDLAVSMSGGSGDADLYLRFGSEPTTGSYDCRPWSNGNNENCPVASPNAGVYFIGIRGYGVYSNTNLSVSFTAPGGATGGELVVNNIAASQGNWQNFSIDVPAGMSQLDIDISGGSGDADLYVRLGNQPTTSTYNCRPYSNGNNENCSFSSPAAGTWFIGIRAYRTYSGVTLNAVYNP